MNYYLIKYKWNPFEIIHEIYDSGDPYRTGGTVLVKAHSFDDATNKIRGDALSKREYESDYKPESFEFENLTIE